MTRQKIPSNLHSAFFKQKAEKLLFLKDELEKYNHSLYFVGGCVRDALLGVKPKDYDLTTSAPVELVERIVKSKGYSTVDIGREHGTVGFYKGKEFYEATTFRKDVHCDGRWAQVEFVDSLYEDSLRRDFTINSLYLDFDKNIIDYHGGVEDLEKQVVKFVGDPQSRIKEDYLRILRFFRFATVFSKANFDEDSFCAATDVNNLDGLANISRERIREELFKIASAHNARQIFKLMIENGVLEKCGFFITNREVFLDKLRIDLIASFASQIGHAEVEAVSRQLVLSKKEKLSLAYLVKNKNKNRKLLDYLLDYHHYEVNVDDIIRLLKYKNEDVEKFLGLLEHVPPYDGSYVKEKCGFTGVEVGRKLLELRKKWLEDLLHSNT